MVMPGKHQNLPPPKKKKFKQNVKKKKKKWKTSYYSNLSQQPKNVWCIKHNNQECMN